MQLLFLLHFPDREYIGYHAVRGVRGANKSVPLRAAGLHGVRVTLVGSQASPSLFNFTNMKPGQFAGKCG